MKKFTTFCLSLLVVVTAMAVPAKRGWQTRTQADGTTIEVQQFGDEFYHYMINRDGKQVREINGMYVVVGEAPTAEVAKARRAQGVARRQRQEVGVTPNLAPKGVVILANFSDKSMQSGHTNATFNELCNSTNCTVNSGYPSAREYFKSQSNGSYSPQFDVFGPVTLSNNVAYYGKDKSEEGDDQHATTAVVEACKLADQQFSINWADYDSDNDGYVDFVYVIYAGLGQADGGAANTIWPHNWSIIEACSYGTSGYCTYPQAQCQVGGKKLDNYAMSSELSSSALSGIGTLCHEFGHVMGLPDLYDTSYGDNYNNCVTPNDWNIMDGGSYNADGHCPPNYDPWQKDFFGWHTPINLGTEGKNVTLYANGTTNYQAYQINATGSYVSPTTSGVRYYIENRQAVGWDAPLTGHGMLIWKVNFNSSKWQNNEPNNTSGNPYYTVVSASGTKIGWDGSTDNCPKNTFPGSKNVTSWTGVSGKPLLNIAESNQIVTLTYIEEPVIPVDPFTLTFMANGGQFAQTQSTGKVVLPATNPLDCPCGKVFLGWTATAGYESETTAPTYVKANDAVTEATTYYAVYADQEGEGGAAVSDVLTRATTGVTGTQYTSWSNKTVTSPAVYAGQSAGGYESIQLRSNNSNSGVITTASGGKLTKVAVVWNSNTASGRKLEVYGKNSAYDTPSDLYDASAKGTKLGTIMYMDGSSTELTIEGDYTYVGVRSLNNALYLDQLTFTWGGGASYSNYSTACGCWYTDIEQTEVNTPADVRKEIRDGQLVIIRGNAVYSLTGSRIE